MMYERHRYKLLYTDTGGTFTDTFVVDQEHDFVVAKAPSTPHDIAEGYLDSLGEAAKEIGIPVEGSKIRHIYHPHWREETETP